MLTAQVRIVRRDLVTDAQRRAFVEDLHYFCYEVVDDGVIVRMMSPDVSSPQTMFTVGKASDGSFPAMGNSQGTKDQPSVSSKNAQ